jgi:uncharacterized membrane protein
MLTAIACGIIVAVAAMALLLAITAHRRLDDVQRAVDRQTEHIESIIALLEKMLK